MCNARHVAFRAPKLEETKNAGHMPEKGPIRGAFMYLAHFSMSEAVYWDFLSYLDCD
jgi:hypothetical protein